MAYPETFRYTKEHEWIEVEGKTAKIGITDYVRQVYNKEAKPDSFGIGAPAPVPVAPRRLARRA